VTQAGLEEVARAVSFRRVVKINGRTGLFVEPSASELD
jgi:hypothetical protein